MGDRISKVKNHLKENKTVYLVGIGSAMVGAAVAVVVVVLKNPGIATSQRGLPVQDSVDRSPLRCCDPWVL